MASVDIASVHASSRVPSMVLESTSGPASSRPVMPAVLGRVPVVAAFVLPPTTDIVAIAASAVFVVLAVIGTTTVVSVSPISVAAAVLVVAVVVLVTLSHPAVAAIIPMVTTEIATVTRTAAVMVLAVVVPALAATSVSPWLVATLVLPNNNK